MDHEPIRVLVVDDHPVVRAGIKALLAEIPDMRVVGEASDGQTAVRLAEQLRVDVVLMDLVMPGGAGVDAIREISARHAQTRIVALTSFSADDKVFPALKAGAIGYLLKETAPQDLIRAIRQAHSGEPSLDPTVARKLLKEFSQNSDQRNETYCGATASRSGAAPTAPTDESEDDALGTRPASRDILTALSGREKEVLTLVARGMSNQAIANALFVSEATIRTHVSNILAKLHLGNRVQATLCALQAGLTELDADSIQLATRRGPAE